METFRLTIIPETTIYVVDELLEKFPDVQIVHQGTKTIDFQSESRQISDFRYLMSPLRIQDTHHNDFDLFKREWRKAFVPAGINPSLAYIICRIAKLQKTDTILDPFCGGATIPITTYVNFRVAGIYASDISGKAIKISQLNFEAAKIPTNKFKLMRKDVAKLALKPKSITKVITNLPFGIRVGNHESNRVLYLNFSKMLFEVLSDDGVAYILTQEKKLIYETMEKQFLIKEVLVVDQGGLNPSLYRLIKRE